jgi:predicted DsbA family dithiol-disulfide isomerase
LRRRIPRIRWSGFADWRSVIRRSHPGILESVIEVFADIWCPFTHVGLKFIDEHRQRSGRTDIGIHVRAWPLELVNGRPMDPVSTRANAAELRSQVAPDLFNSYHSPDTPAEGAPSWFPSSTLDALALAARAYRQDVHTGEAVSFALRTALFEQAQDISNPEVLASIAEAHNLTMPEDQDRDAVTADWEEGRRREVIGSPHFFKGGDSKFCVALQISRDPKTGLSVQVNSAALESFFSEFF